MHQTHKIQTGIDEYEAAGVTIDNNYDGRLKALQERRRDLYIKANNKKNTLKYCSY